MKSKILISLLFFFVGINLKSQNYFPKGAVWHYHAPEIGSGSFSYNLLKSKGDTIFNGDTLTYIEGFVNCAEGYNELIKAENKKIYRLDTCDSNYTLLYDFGANVGDTIKYYPFHCNSGPQDSMIYVIDSIKPININGNILDQFFITYTPLTSIYIGTSLIEGIGGNESFYPVIGYCDPVGGPLRCYYDSIIGEYKNQHYYGSAYAGSCDTIFVGINELALNLTTAIYPNPTSDIIYIETNHVIETLEIFTINGQKLLSTKNKEINMSNYSNGIYFLKISFQEGVIYKKIVKE